MAASPDDAEPTAWHALSPEEVADRLASGSEGLSPEEAGERLEEYGPNVLHRSRREGVLAMLGRQVNDPLIHVLLVSAILALALGRLVDGLVVLAVVIGNSIIGFIQEYRATREIEALVELVPQQASVVRGGETVEIDARRLVPGDRVVLRSGDFVPADLRLVERRAFSVDESALTGESEPVPKTHEALSAAVDLADRRNTAHAGTYVASGRATGIVVATGASTELGRISTMLGETTRLETPLTRKMDRVSKWIAGATVLLTGVLFGIGLGRGYPLVDAVLAAITMAVAAIPEGLPAIITIALAIGVRRMAGRRAIVRQLPAVETLGSTTVICSDKTGTLTRNEMTVQVLWTPDGRVDLREGGAAEAPSPALERLLGVGVLCSDVIYRPDAPEEERLSGDPTERALLVAALDHGLDPGAIREEVPRLDTVPFEPERRWMASLHEEPDGDRVVYVKGAPEAVLERCRRGVDGEELDEGAVRAAADGLADQGMRVLAMARSDRPTREENRIEPEDVGNDLALVGLQAMIDPPRSEAVEAVATCLGAGVEVKMVTGDHAGTARQIARELGMLGDGDDGVVVGRELEDLSDEELGKLVRERSVFARVAPEHKLRLVRSLQAGGEIVAMTGDGVNDAPALKQADIGVAMGQAGTGVAKESADIVLTDDNFATIEAAVEEGRRVHDNLVKSLAFVLPTNLGEAIVITLAVLFFPIVGGHPIMPISPVQILWINLVATVSLALPLAFEAMEPDLMERPPREPDRPILDAFVLQRTVVVACLMTAAAVGLFLAEVGLHPAERPPPEALAQAQTMAVSTIIIFQAFYLLTCRSLTGSILEIGLFTNPAVYLGIALITLLHLGFVYLPFMNAVFGSAPLPFRAWILPNVLGATIVPIIALEKGIRRRWTARGG